MIITTPHDERVGKFYPVGFSAHGGTIGRLHWINSTQNTWGFVHWDGRDYQPSQSQQCKSF